MYNIRMKWLTIACFEIQFGQTTVVTDPCITANELNDLTWENIEHCDIITLSHSHWDHVTDIPVLMENFPHAPLLTGVTTAAPMLKWLDTNPVRVYPMDSNLELDFGDVKIKALFGKHRNQNRSCSVMAKRGAENKYYQTSPELGAELTVIGTLEYRNYLFTARNGTKILLWGNGPTIEQKNLVKDLDVDIAIIQCTTADPQELADLAEVAANSGAKILIPHHMDFAATVEKYSPNVEMLKQEFLKRVPEGTFILPENNSWISL